MTRDASSPAMRRPSRRRMILAAIYALLALNAWAQVLLVPIGMSDGPHALTALQALIGACGAAAAWTTWRGSRRAPVAAMLHGAATATMLLTLEPMLDLGPEARGGLWTGAAATLAFASWAAWYLRRSRPAADVVRASRPDS